MYRSFQFFFIIRHIELCLLIWFGLLWPDFREQVLCFNNVNASDFSHELSSEFFSIFEMFEIYRMWLEPTARIWCMTVCMLMAFVFGLWVGVLNQRICLDVLYMCILRLTRRTRDWVLRLIVFVVMRVCCLARQYWCQRSVCYSWNVLCFWCIDLYKNV